MPLGDLRHEAQHPSIYIVTHTKLTHDARAKLMLFAAIACIFWSMQIRAVTLRILEKPGSSAVTDNIRVIGARRDHL